MYRLRTLPLDVPIGSLEVYKELSKANLNLGELKGILTLLPNLPIILKLISLSEAKSSAEIENTYASVDDFFIERTSRKMCEPKTTKTASCMRAMNIGYKDLLKSNKITVHSLMFLQEVIEPSYSGIRKSPGLKIYNKTNSEVIHIPPQNENIITSFLTNLEFYINNDVDNYDPLIKMALIHFQFECIHPFKDGNGRTGRILNTLFLILTKRLDYPIINLSKYLHDTADEYFRLLAKCHYNVNNIEEFILYILKGITITSRYTIDMLKNISQLIVTTNYNLRNLLPNIYRDDLAEHLFIYPYTKNELFRSELNLSRATATKYLKILEDKGFVTSIKIGKEVLYRNVQLDNIFHK